MARKFCIMCGHRCHCVGQGYYVNVDKCDTCTCERCECGSVILVHLLKNLGGKRLKGGYSNGDCQDGLQIYCNTNYFIMPHGIFWRACKMRKQCKQCKEAFDATINLIYFAAKNVRKKH